MNTPNAGGRLPGSFLCRLLEAVVDERDFETTVVPTLADLQHEALRGEPNWLSRRLALMRGYAALVRVLIACVASRRISMRRLFAIAASGAACGVLVILTAGSRVQSAVFLTFAAMAIVAVVATRLWRSGRTYREVFEAFAGAGVIATAAFFIWLWLGPTPPRRLSGTLVLRLSSLVGFVLIVSVLAAAWAWKPPAGTHPVFRGRLLGILIACGVFALTAFLSTGGWFIRSWVSLAVEVSWYVYFAVLYFGIACAAIYLPILLAARRVIRARALMPIIGAALFPIPIVALDFLQGQPMQHLGNFGWLVATWPSRVEAALPYVVGGAVLGWKLCERESRPENMTGQA